MTQSVATDGTELYLMGEGVPTITLVKADPRSSVGNLVKVAREHGLSSPDDLEVFVFLENSDTPLELDAKIEEVGLISRSRVHMHSLKEVEVTVNFNRAEEKGLFAPSTTVDRVKEWAVGKDRYDMPPVDAAEHVLKLCHSGIEPDRDAHIGTLVKIPDGKICFDLGPAQRVEG